jgi:hypothetical protein
MEFKRAIWTAGSLRCLFYDVFAARFARGFNSTITHLRLGFDLAARYSASGLGLKIQGRFVLLHPLRRPRHAGRFDVSSLALTVRFSNSGFWLMSAIV